MAIFDRTHGGYRVFVGDLGSRVGKYELEREFEFYGPLIDVWVARNPPGFAFVVYKHCDDAEKSVRDLDGRVVCGRRVRVEHARPYEPRSTKRAPPIRSTRGGGGGVGGGGGGGGGMSRRYNRNDNCDDYTSRSRSMSKERVARRSRSPRRRRSNAHSRSRSRSFSPGEKTPKVRSSSRSRSPLRVAQNGAAD